MKSSNFQHRWFGRGGHISWPQTRTGRHVIFLWEHLNNLWKILNLNHLKVIITDAVSTMKREILTNVWANIDYCLDVSVKQLMMTN